MIRHYSPFVLTLFLSLCLFGCNTTGSPWSAGQTAQTAPSVLTETTLGAETEGVVYDPYNYYIKNQLETDAARTNERVGVQQVQRQDLQPSIPAYKSVVPTPRREKVKVAILLPLSGSDKHIGKEMLNAAQLALFDIGDPAFELLPKDTKGTIDGAIIAANDAIYSGAKLILGPLFADNVKALRPIIRQAGIYNIAFTTDGEAVGENTYSLGILPHAQVDRIIQYVASQGYKDYSLIATKNEYGNIVRNSYMRSVRKYRGRPAGELMLNPMASNISPQIREFVNYDVRKAQHEELMEAVETVLEQNPRNRAALKQKAELDLYNTNGDLPFEVVMVPIGGDDAKTIVNLLRFYEVDNHNSLLIGTGLWDDPGLIKEPAFNGALFAAPSPQARSEFESSYSQLYGKRPVRISSLAYDATALAAVLASRAYAAGVENDAIYTATTIESPNGFSGIDGIFRFGRNKLAQRGLAVLQIQNDRLIVKDPAPSTFQSSIN